MAKYAESNWIPFVIRLLVLGVLGLQMGVAAQPQSLTSGHLVIGGDENYPPYEYLDDQGVPVGYNVDLTRALAEVLGVTVTFRFGPWQEVRGFLESGEVDALQGVFFSEERSQQMLFSQPHTIINHVSVVRSKDRSPPESIEQLRKLRIVVMQRDIMHDFVLENGLTQITTVPNQEEALRQLAEGHHDCALLAQIPALHWIKVNQWENLTASTKPLLSCEYCYAVQPGQEALLARIAEGLKTLQSTGEYQKIRNKWLGIYQAESGWAGRAAKMLLALLLVVVAALLIALLWSRSLHRKVENRTAEILRQQLMLEHTEQAAHVGSWEWDIATDTVTWSKELFHIFGRDPNFGGVSFKDHRILYPPEDMQTLRVAVDRAVHDGEPYQLELNFLHSSGEQRHCLVHGFPEQDKTGNVIRLWGAFQDITERKRSEELVRQSEERYRQLAENSQAISWEYLVEEDRWTYIAPQSQQVLQFAPEEWTNRAFWLNRIHPEDRERVGQQSATTNQGSQVDVEYRFQKKDGEYVWLRDLVTVEYRDGAVYKLWGTTINVTRTKNDQQRLAQALAESEQRQRLTQSLYESARAILECHSFEQSARKIFDLCCEVTGAVSGYVALLSASGEENEVLFLESGGLPCDVDENLPMPIRGLRGEAYAGKKAVYENDFMNSPWVHFMPPGHVVMNNVLFAPMIIDNQVVGVIGLANKPSDFTEDDARMAAAFGDMASIALQRARSEENLIEAEQRFRMIFEQANDGILLAKQDASQFVLANNTFCQMLGYSADELYQLGVKDIHPVDSLEMVKAKFQKQLSGELRLSKSTPVQRKDGTVFFADVSAASLELNGRTYLMGIFRDVTIQKRAEEALIEAKNIAEEAHLSKNRFIANISHELRTPLNGILGFTEILLHTGGEDPGKCRHYLEIIRDSGKHLLGLINDVLDIAKVDANKMELHLKDYPARELIESAVAIVRVNAQQRQLSIDVHLPEVPVFLHVDRRLVQQVLLNLFSNAIKFSPDGSVIEVLLENAAPGWARITVKDQGIGIPPEKHDLIFQEFYQVEETLSVNPGGTGLGLSLCRRIVELHGGQMGIESGLGKGSAFWFEMPVSDSVSGMTHLDDGADHSENHKSIKGHKVLIAEDNEVNLELAVALLEELGLRPLAARNGVECLALARSQHPDLILMDMQMPTMTGFEATRVLKNDLDMKHIPIIALTASVDDESIRQTQLCGCDAHLNKPIDPDLLVYTLERFL